MDDRSKRQIARRDRRNAGDRSTKLATQLMKLSKPVLAKLDLGDDEDELRAVIDDARAITSHIARRRAERALAGALRRFDLDALAGKLDALSANAAPDVRKLHAAEAWRAKLIESGMAAAAELPGAADDAELPRLVEAAQRERATGKPPGAARALFRHITQLLGSAR